MKTVTDETFANITDYNILTTDNTGGPILGTPYPLYNMGSSLNSSISSISAIITKQKRILCAFCTIMYGTPFKYPDEKDMPNDVFIKYCNFRNKIKDMEMN